MKKSKERIKQRKVDNEPSVIVYENDTSNVSKILGWYRDHNITTDIQKQWIIDAANKLQLKDREVLVKVPDCWIVDTTAFVSRMFCNELNLTERNLDYLTAKIKELIEIGRVSQERLDNRVPAIERLKENAQTHIEILNERIDCDPDYNVIDYIISCNLSIGYVRQIAKSLLETATKQKEDIEKWIEDNKSERKPRTKKVKTPEDICKKFICLQEWENIKTIKPEKVIDSECVVYYHTGKKRIGFLVGEKLNVHLSMIVGFDQTKSKEFHCSDKNLLLSGKFNGKMSVNKIRKELEKKEAFEVTGRIGEKTIILGRY